MNPQKPLMALALAALLALCLTAPAQALYRDNGVSLWPGGLVPVCWETGLAPDGSGSPTAASAHPNFANLQAVIRDTVEGGWGRTAKLSFVGWGDCPSRSPSGNPGTLALYFLPGGADFSGVGYSSAYSTRMQLDPDLLATNEGNFRGLVLHEFAHALGFSHEMDRPDWVVPTVGNPCVGRRGNGTDPVSNYLRTPADQASVTTFTYCLGTSPGVLSPWDIVGVQAAYGVKPAGSIVGADNRCIDVPSSDFSTGVRLQTYGCHGGTNQLWRTRADLSVSPVTALGLNVNVVGAFLTPGTPVQLYTRGSLVADNEKWRLADVQIKGIGDFCLEVPGSDYRPGVALRVAPCTGAINQLFRLDHSRSALLATGAIFENLCLAAPSPAASGGLVKLADCDAAARSQRFTFTNAGTIRFGSYCLDVRGGAPVSGSLLQLFSCHGQANQRWHFSGPIRGNGGACLEIAGGRAVDGAQLQMGGCRASALDQQWDYYLNVGSGGLKAAGAIPLVSTLEEDATSPPEIVVEEPPSF